jgi:hypothetical protein
VVAARRKGKTLARTPWAEAEDERPMTTAPPESTARPPTRMAPVDEWTTMTTERSAAEQWLMNSGQH